MLKMLFLALAVVVLLPPSIPACDVDKIRICTGNEEHTLHLLGSPVLTGNINLDLRNIAKVTLKARGHAEVGKINTNSDGSITISLDQILVDVDSYLVDGGLTVVLTVTGGLANGRYGILAIDADAIVKDRNINMRAVPVNFDEFRLAIKGIVKAAIGNHRESYRKYLQDCFDAHAICA